MNEFKCLRIGCSSIAYEGNKVYAVRPRLGCKDCVFQSEDGAQHCYMKTCCMAHSRPDRTSVIFITK